MVAEKKPVKKPVMKTSSVSKKTASKASGRMEQNKLLVLVRVRGEVGIRKPISDTMEIMRLYHKNYSTLIWTSESMLGMINKIRDYITFGEIDESTLIDLLKERGRIAGNKKLTAEFLKTQKLTFESLAKDLIAGKIKLKDVAGVKQFFRLAPPRGGFERKGIKHSFSVGGALGYRKEKINELVKKML